MIRHLDRDEWETTINIDALSDTAEIYSSDQVWIRKMDKLVEKNPDQFKVTDVQYYDDGAVISKCYEFPKRFVSIRSKDVIYSDEQRAEMASHFKRNKNTDSESV